MSNLEGWQRFLKQMQTLSDQAGRELLWAVANRYESLGVRGAVMIHFRRDHSVRLQFFPQGELKQLGLNATKGEQVEQAVNSYEPAHQVVGLIIYDTPDRDLYWVDVVTVEGKGWG
jgi:hypothetical protein